MSKENETEPEIDHLVMTITYKPFDFMLIEDFIMPRTDPAYAAFYAMMFEPNAFSHESAVSNLTVWEFDLY